jgi:hypothetical protein
METVKPEVISPRGRHMDEAGNQPREQSFWKQPIEGRSKKLLCFGVMLFALFVVALVSGLTLSPATGLGQIIPFSLLFAVVLTVVVYVGIVVLRWLCCWRNLRRVLFAAACLVTVIALAYAEENWRGHRAWVKHRKQLEAKREKFDFVALAPPPVPEEKNFAMTPLLKPILDYAPEESDPALRWRDTNGIARLERISAERTPDNEGRRRLGLGSVEKGTFANMDTLSAFYRGNTNYPQASDGAKRAAVVLAGLGKFDSELKELRAGAASRPESRFPVHYNQEPGWWILLRHLAPVKALTTLTHVHAVAELEDGRAADALEDLKLGLRLSDSISKEPLLIDHLVRLSTLGIDLQTIREGIHRHAWTDGQLAEIEQNLSSINLLAEYKLGMRGERACTTGSLDWMRRNNHLWNNPLDQLDTGAVPQPTMFAVPSGWFYQNMVTFSRLHESSTLAVADENKRLVFPEVAEEGKKAFERLRFGPYTVLAKVLFPALENAVRRSAQMQSWLDSAQLACALERYRLSNGTLPDKLDRLVPKFIAAIPNDVMDGKPLRYKPEASGAYVIYSIGWNQRDDGGQIAWKEGGKPDEGRLVWNEMGKEKGVDIEKGDWVFRME